VFARYLGSAALGRSVTETVRFAIAKAETRVSGVERDDGGLAVEVGAVDSSVVPAGPVRVLEGGRVLASAPLSGGVAQVRLAELAPGEHRLELAYDGDDRTEPSAGVVTLSVPAASPAGPDPTGPLAHPAATSVTVGKAKVLRSRKVRLKVAVSAPGSAATGTVVVKRGKKVVATGVLQGGKVTLTTKRLPRGRTRLTVSYGGAAGLSPSTATPVKVRIR